MKVYVVMEYSVESSEIIDVFDSLEKAQAYRNGKPEDWSTDTNINKWWERTIREVGKGTCLNVHVGISEWEVN